MKSSVAVYPTHHDAVIALESLHEKKFPLKKISLVGKAEVTEDQIKIRNLEKIKNSPPIIGAAAGPILGLLSGIGVFSIPGFGFLFGAGAIVGMIAGFDIGIAAGGLLSLLAAFGIKKDHALKCEEHIRTGKFLVIVEGNEKEISEAKKILHTDGKFREAIA